MKISGIYVGRIAAVAFGVGLTLSAGQASACGSEPYLGEVCFFTSSYCPKGFTPADGRMLPVSTDSGALYSVLGNKYGGDYQKFALPDLRGRVVVGTRAEEREPGTTRPSENAVKANKETTEVVATAPQVALTVCIASSLSFARYPERPDW